MKKHYRIAPEGVAGAPTDAEIARYRDPQKLLYNYQRAVKLLHRRPLYKDPKSLLALLLIVLLAILVSEAMKDRRDSAPVHAPREGPAAP